MIGHKVGNRVDLKGQWKINKILMNLLDPQNFHIVLWMIARIN